MHVQYMGVHACLVDIDFIRFEQCWPAMWKDTHGVVLVHNPVHPQQEKELERWSVIMDSWFALIRE